MTNAPAPLPSPLAARVAAMSQADYERFVVAEVLAGRVPAAASALVAVPVSAGALSGVFWCWSMPLCVGTDDNVFHAPLPAPAAQRIADALGLSLPTRRMVDAIRAAASTHVPFRSYSEGRGTPRTFAASSEGIEQRRAGRGGLVSDYAKDYVLSNQRRSNPARITIYGAWDASGALVQPLATPHGINYYDYSQQPRFVSQAVEVNGVRTTLAAALASPGTAALFSAEGTITGAMLRY